MSVSLSFQAELKTFNDIERVAEECRVWNLDLALSHQWLNWLRVLV
jgi:hypothetical protein